MSDHLSSEQLASLRRRLEDERARLLQRALTSLGQEELADPGDLQDQASDEARHRLMLSLSDIDRARLSEVEAALARMDRGTYGECEETGEPIPFGRLQAEPTTRYTVEALEMLEDEDAREKAKGPDRSDDVY